jgi:hypothetical protein
MFLILKVIGPRLHGELEEIMPDDDPEPQVWFATSTKYLDSNLKHQALSATIETGAYGSVFDSAWNCIKKIIDLPNMTKVTCWGMSNQ